MKNINSIATLRHDLLSTAGNSGTQGMAYVGNICEKSGSASIIEDVGGMATSVIAAHEIIHRFHLVC